VDGLIVSGHGCERLNAAHALKGGAGVDGIGGQQMQRGCRLWRRWRQQRETLQANKSVQIAVSA